ncbi:hypothetical protein [Brachyspira sp. G79]|uniref:hypothetical protein n=1 Tax=Brachyspira sp. G79 TaxID=1358104 RepID=UPI000BBCE776|nr:hypothetical protein [Brachyspira sp. G79]PCG19164.1 hypothetical protein KQ44_03205 [Brachyspira sp. G79]
MNKKLYLTIFLLILFTISIISCKKINLLSPSIIPPPTEFPNNEQIPQYPIPSPTLQIPPEKIEEKYIIVTPEIVQNGTVFGGYSRRFKFNNEWHILATNEYQYDPNTKKLSPTGKGAVLKIDNNGKTITKIHSLSLGDDLEKTEYWTNLNSRKVLIEQNKVTTLSEVKSVTYIRGQTYSFPDGNIVDNTSIYDPNFRVIYLYELRPRYRESASLINWNDSANQISKKYYLPNTNFNNPNIQGRLGYHAYLFFFYFKGKLLFTPKRTYVDENPTGYRDPSAPEFSSDSREYYYVDIEKDTSDEKNWVTNQFPFPEKRWGVNVKFYNDKIYIYGGETSKYECIGGIWYEMIGVDFFTIEDGIWSTEDGVNWKEEKNVDTSKLGYVPINNVALLGYGDKETTPFEPKYTELNGKYYRTFNTTYPIPPVKEIIEAVERFETNFTITEEHIKNSGIYQIQMSSVHPDNAKETDWVTIVPKNQTTSSTAWASGGADLFNFNGKLVRLVDYDREFKLNTQYQEALNLSKQYYNLLEMSKTMSDYKKYNYYYLYYKAMADMIKIIIDKSNDYFKPDKAFTHYIFEIN